MTPPTDERVTDERLAELIQEADDTPDGNYPEDIRRKDDCIAALRELQRRRAADAPIADAGMTAEQREALERGAKWLEWSGRTYRNQFPECAGKDTERAAILRALAGKGEK